MPRLYGGNPQKLAACTDCSGRSQTTLIAGSSERLSSLIVLCYGANKEVQPSRQRLSLMSQALNGFHSGCRANTGHSCVYRLADSIQLVCAEEGYHFVPAGEEKLWAPKRVRSI